MGAQQAYAREVADGDVGQETSSAPSEKARAKARILNRNSVRKRNSQVDIRVPLLPGSQKVQSYGKASHAPKAKDFLSNDVSPQHRIIVIGDLHGMAHKAKAVWRELEDALGEKGLIAALVVFMGDYVDRGQYTKELLAWLLSIKSMRERQGARTVFLLGNHEFCLLGFLGLLRQPPAAPDFSFRETWDCEDRIARAERDRWWGNHEEANVVRSTHLQGRRWGGSWYERSYGSHATFASYGADMGNREGLRCSMPQDHVDFLQNCPWVHIEENPLLGRCIFVHAGLEADSSEDCEEQLARLKQRDPRHPQPEQLFGREGVLHTPPQLAKRGTTVISGHHGKVQLRSHRVILDSCSGDDHHPLMALILPEMLLVSDDGSVQSREPATVFGLHLVEMQQRATLSASTSPQTSGRAKPRSRPATAPQATGVGPAGGTGGANECRNRIESRTLSRQGAMRLHAQAELPKGSRRFTLPSTMEGLSRTASEERQRPPGDSSPLE